MIHVNFADNQTAGSEEEGLIKELIKGSVCTVRKTGQWAYIQLELSLEPSVDPPLFPDQISMFMASGEILHLSRPRLAYSKDVSTYTNQVIEHVFIFSFAIDADIE